MDLNSVGILLQTITINYPAARKDIMNAEGKISVEVAKEWQRQIGFLDFNEAVARLDAWMENPNNTKAPMPRDLKKAQSSGGAREYFHSSVRHRYHIENGRVYSENGYEFVHDPCYMGKYIYDSMNQICTQDGRVVEKFL